MTLRERNLLIILLIVMASAGLLVGLGSYLDALSRLDTEFISLQKRALHATQQFLHAEDPGSTSTWGNLRGRFLTPGTLPDPLILASHVQAALKTAGLTILESRVLENTTSAQWVQYHVEGRIETWFRFLELLRKQDGQTLFRSLSMVKKQAYSYAIAFEVGHVVLP